MRSVNIHLASDPSLPSHLEDLLKRSAEGLDEDERMQLKMLLVEFQDVFAKHDLDLGCLSAIQHRIDTKEANPVKNKMR